MNRELVRCINIKKNHVAEFPRFICEDKSWQNSTGYVPQELPLTEMAILPQETTLLKKRRPRITSNADRIQSDT